MSLSEMKLILSLALIPLLVVPLTTSALAQNTTNNTSIPQCYKTLAECMHEITKAQCDTARMKLPLIPENKSLTPTQIVGYTIGRNIIVNACAEKGYN